MKKIFLSLVEKWILSLNILENSINQQIPVKEEMINFLNNHIKKEIKIFDVLKEKINEFTFLKENWDGYGALPLYKDIAEISIDFISKLDKYVNKISDIYPNPNGTLTIRWKTVDDDILSLEIGMKNYSFFIRYSDNDKSPVFVNGYNICLDVEVIVKKFEELFAEFAQIKNKLN